MDELREMVAQLASAQAAAPSSSSAPRNNSSEKVNVEEEEVDEGEREGEGDGDKEKDKGKISKKAPSSNGKGDKEEYHAVPPPSYTPDPLIPHPHINNIGVPPKIEASSSFSQWQYLMQTYLRSSCNELWRIVQKGYKHFNPDNLTRREVVDAQLDSTALLILQQAVSPKELPHIQKFDTAKETWDALETRFLGNDSMKRNRYDELSNEAEGFYMNDDAPL